MYHYGRGIQGFAPDPWMVGPLVVADGILWVWALCMIRISVALMLLRLKDSRWWKSTLATIMTIQMCMIIVGTTMHLVICRPVSARWAPTPAAVCIPPPKFQIYGYVYSGELSRLLCLILGHQTANYVIPTHDTAFTVASDLVLSLLPITFIYGLTRPVHEKVLIGCLMAAGLGATGVALARLFLIMGYVPIGKLGPAMNMVQDLLWGLELTIGVLAASLPSLKAPVHHLLVNWGLMQGNKSSSDMSPESFLEHLPNGSHVTRQIGRWDSNREMPDMYTLQKGPVIRDPASDSTTYLGNSGV